MKSWTYEQITKKAEKEIKHLMAGKHPWDQDWAYGVFLLWKSITMGWQQSGDSERLEALVKNEVPKEAVLPKGEDDEKDD